MSAERFRCLASLAVLALAGSPALAQGVRSYGELEFHAEQPAQAESSHGYTEYRVFIRNKGTENTYRVTLKMPGETLYGTGRGALQSISRTVSVGPGLVSVVSLFQPAVPDVSGEGIAVSVNGRQMKEHLPVRTVSGRRMGPYYYGPRGRGRYYGPGYGGGASQPLVLTSQRVSEKFFEQPAAAKPPGGAAGGAPPGFPAGPGGGGMMPPGAFGGPGIGGAPLAINAQVTHSTTPISAWSSHWLGYTRHDGIVVTPEDVQELQRGSNETRAVLQALWQYTEAGGVLLVVGPGDVSVPQAWKRHVGPKADLSVYSVGFGQCLVAPDRDSIQWRPDRWSEINAAVSATARPWQSSRGLQDLNNDFPVVDNLGVPVIGLFVLMILFSVALGPVNLVVLSKKKKRIWMLWTVPAISGVTCLAVFGYMIVAEGWQGHARVGGITFLDETAHQATSLGRTAFYSPLTPGGGLHFNEETEVQVLGGGEAVPSNCSMDWTQGQHLAHGWVTARVPAHFALRSSETRRERLLNISREADGKLSLVNGLGVNIKKLTVADEKGQLYVAGDILEGQRATLERAKDRSEEEEKSFQKRDYLKKWREIYSGGSDWMNTAENMGRRPQEYLGPRMYLAVVDGSPFHEQALQGANVRNTESVVLGMMAEGEAK